MQTYEVFVQRKPLPMFIQLTDTAMAMKAECPVTLSPLYCPITIRGTEPPHQFSGPIIDEFTKTSKFDPLSDLPLGEKWRIPDFELDKQLTEATGTMPLMGGGKWGTWKTKVNNDINGLVKERCNSIANALELRLSCKH